MVIVTDGAVLAWLVFDEDAWLLLVELDVQAEAVTANARPPARILSAVVALTRRPFSDFIIFLPFSNELLKTRDDCQTITF
jgi:hypothetical protein